LQQGLCLELSARDVLNADLLQVWDCAPGLPHADGRLLNAKRVREGYLRPEVTDGVIDFHDEIFA
jgi:hypothetical protein